MNESKQQTSDTNEHIGEYLLMFVEEFFMSRDPKFEDWAAGRMEVHTYEDEFAIHEIRFCTPRSEAWIELRKKYDGSWVDKNTLEKITEEIKQKFNLLQED